MRTSYSLAGASSPISSHLTAVRILDKISKAFQKVVQNGMNNLFSDDVKTAIATNRKMDVSVEDYYRTEAFNISVATVLTAAILIQNFLANLHLLQALSIH